MLNAAFAEFGVDGEPRERDLQRDGVGCDGGLGENVAVVELSVVSGGEDDIPLLFEDDDLASGQLDEAQCGGVVPGVLRDQVFRKGLREYIA